MAIVWVHLIMRANVILAGQVWIVGPTVVVTITPLVLRV
jgi:hypothetical protein